MNGISHKQARRYMLADLDGLLTDSQRRDLETHLRECDACRAESESFSTLTARLQSGFHARWDTQNGPSDDVIANIHSQTRRIKMTNRINLGLRVLAGIAALLVLGFVINSILPQLRENSIAANGTESVGSLAQVDNRLLAFTSEQNGNYDIYTMRSDGSELTNITNNPAVDSTPFWSPDGKRIAFMSDRDGSNQLYLMDANGSNVVQLTNGEGYYWFDVNGYTPWSPDGRKLVFSHKLPDEQAYKLYVMDIVDKTIITLTNEASQYFLTSWSPDGEYIAFAEDTGRAPKDLFVVASDGSQLTNLTETLQGGDFFTRDYEWSPDGDSLFFATSKKLYRSTADGTMEVIAEATNQIFGWWNGGAGRLEMGEDVWSWLRSDGSQSTLHLCEKDNSLRGIAYKQSHRGDWVLGMNCSTSGWMFYWANSDGTITDQLLNSPISLGQQSLFNLTWSPDDQYLAFVSLDTASPDATETLYVLDVEKAREDPSIQPLIFTESFGASWQPVQTPKLANDSPEMKIDPQSCKPASELNSNLQPPNELYGYKLIQGTSLVDGDFTYDFWLYCDSSLKPDDPENYSAIAGLGISPSWRYTGPRVEGPVDFSYEFEPNVSFGRSGSSGPLYKASATGARFGIDIPKTTVQAYIQGGTPIQFRVIVDSPLGRNGAILSFNLEPTEHGYKIANLHADSLNHIDEGLIAFTSEQNGNFDIYTMRADGSEMTNLTNNPAHDGNPIWSPDGKRIAFESRQQLHANLFDGRRWFQSCQIHE